MATFTKNDRTGNYDVIGLESEVFAGGSVKVTKKDGSVKTVSIDRVSKPFVAKYGPLKGQKVVIGTMAYTGDGSRGRTDYRTQRQGNPYARFCGYPCPVTGRRCCANDPCHDCQ